MQMIILNLVIFAAPHISGHHVFLVVCVRRIPRFLYFQGVLFCKCAMCQETADELQPVAGRPVNFRRVIRGGMVVGSW